MSDVFDFRRLVHLLWVDLVNNYRSLLIISGAVAAVMLLQALLFQPAAVERELAYLTALGLIFFLWGPIAASRSFLELHDKKRNEAWLLLPASALEKVVARLLFVTVLFIPFGLLLVTLISVLTSGTKAILLGVPEALFIPGADVLNLNSLGSFIMHQSLFFLGAAWFRKNHFVKTGFSVSVIAIGLLWFFAIAARIILPDLGTTWFSVEAGPFFETLGESVRVLAWFGQVFGFVVIPVFCWFVAWLRVRETQVSYGI